MKGDSEVCRASESIASSRAIWTPFWDDIILFERLEDKPILLKSLAHRVWGHVKRRLPLSL